MMPADFNLFAEDFKKEPNDTWIMKPAAKGKNRLSKLTHILNSLIYTHFYKNSSRKRHIFN